MMKQGVNSDGEVIRSAYVEHDPVDAPWANDGRTRQEFAEECDINFILQRYEKTGVINHYHDGAPQYLDLSDMPSDLQGALLYVDMANESFMRLPAKVRREFDNDPVQFADYACKPENLEQMREWGLAPPKNPVDASIPDRPGGEPEPKQEP